MGKLRLPRGSKREKKREKGGGEGKKTVVGWGNFFFKFRSWFGAELICPATPGRWAFVCSFNEGSSVEIKRGIGRKCRGERERLYS